MSGRIEANEVVECYARAFYRTVNPALLAVHTERAEALAEGIAPSAVRSLYEIGFDDIQPTVYDWLANCALAVTRVGQQARALPGIVDRDARQTDFAANIERHAADVGRLMFNGDAVMGAFALAEGDVPLELLYTLLALFNNSHALTAREKVVVPASLAMLVQDCTPDVPQWSSVVQLNESPLALDALAIFKPHGLPVLAPGVHASEVYYAAEGQAGPQIWYPTDLWANIA